MDPHSKPITIVIALVIVVALVGLVWYLRSVNPGNTVAPSSARPAGNAEATPKDLGSQLYGQVQNPVQGKLPDTVAPVTNPLQGVYKNPFSQ